MALSNNLVLSKSDHKSLVEELKLAQPGDRVRVTLEATLVENLADKATFDVVAVESATVTGGDADEAPARSKSESILADSVLGVMGKKKS